MRKRSLAVIAALGLLGGVAQVDAHGGGFHSGGAPHGGASHLAGPPPIPASIAPLAQHDGPSYAVAPAQARDDEGTRHDYRQDNDYARRGDFGRDRDRVGGSGLRIGFPGGPISFAPRPPNRRPPILYNYYYGVGDGYYVNAPSDYGTASNACPGWRWDASSQTKVWTTDCQG